MHDIDKYLPEITSMLVGSIISLAVSWIFYKKAEFSAKATSSMTDDIIFLLISNKLDIDFNYSFIIDKYELPRDEGVPHILQYWLSKKSIKRGEETYLLFRVQDKGFDFPHQNGIEIIESESNVIFEAKRMGHGYYYSCINTSKAATQGWHSLTINLKDENNNQHSHVIKFEVL